MYTNREKFAEEITQPSFGLARERFNYSAFELQAQALIDSHESITHDGWELEPELNARTAIFEELTAKGHLSRIVFDGDVDAVNQRTLVRLLNGWSDHHPDWEKKRRFYEIVEELVVQNSWQEIRDGNLPSDTLVFTISDFPEEASDEWAHTIGYRSLNKKGMVRSTHFEQDEQSNWRRVIEQISRSNSNDDSSGRLLSNSPDACDIYDTSLKVLSNQLIATRSEFPSGVVGLQQELDKLSGPSVMYGESVETPNLPSYDELRKVSAAREAQVQNHIKRLANYEININQDYKAGKISYDQKLRLLKIERTKIVDEICLLAPAYAEDARGKKSAELFLKASHAMASGHHGAGQAYLAEAIAVKDPRASAVCGGNGIQQAQMASLSNQSSAQEIYLSVLEERKNWRWTKGYCIAPECTQKDKYVDVGPCSVCRECQDVFDGKIKVDIFAPIKDHIQRLREQEELRKAKARVEELEKAA